MLSLLSRDSIVVYTAQPESCWDTGIATRVHCQTGQRKKVQGTTGSPMFTGAVDEAR
jgi:hypothetical protein